MPLFRRDREPARPRRTINGSPQPHPEGSGEDFARRSRLFMECARRLASHPLTQPQASATPLGDGRGLEDLVARITPLFAVERSLIRWVALRGAFTELFIRVYDRTSAVVTPDALEQAMALTWTDDTPPRAALAEPWRSSLSRDEHDAAFGLAASVLVRVEDYPRYSELPVQEVLRWAPARMSDAVALDCIAWSATSLLRLGIAQQLIPQVPEPDAFDSPGWYPEPLFAKAQRYWDGTDWTSRCRTNDGQLADVPLA